MNTVTIPTSARQAAMREVCKRVAKGQHGTLPNMGSSNVEFDHRCAAHPDYPENVFVVGNHIGYHNRSINDMGRTVYVFDLNGNEVKNFNKSRFTGAFFNSLTYLN